MPSRPRRPTRRCASVVPLMKPITTKAKEKREGHLGEPVDLLQHEGRAGDEGEEPAIGERRQAPRRPGSPDGASSVRKPRRIAAKERVGTGERGGCVSGSRSSDDGGERTGRTGSVAQKVARQPKTACRTPPRSGASGRHQAHDRAHAGQFPAGPRALVEVAHDGPAEHDRARRRRAPARSGRRRGSRWRARARRRGSPAMKRPSPNSSTGFRPIRSETGP